MLKAEDYIASEFEHDSLYCVQWFDLSAEPSTPRRLVIVSYIAEKAIWSTWRSLDSDS